MSLCKCTLLITFSSDLPQQCRRRSVDHGVDRPQQGRPGLVVEGDDDWRLLCQVVRCDSNALNIPEVGGRSPPVRYFWQSSCEDRGRERSETPSSAQSPSEARHSHPWCGCLTKGDKTADIFIKCIIPPAFTNFILVFLLLEISQNYFWTIFSNVGFFW